MVRPGIWNATIAVAAVAGGLWLYSRYGPRRYRSAVAVAAGTTVGQEVGRVAGLALGRGAVVPAAVAGAVAGALLTSRWLGPERGPSV